MSQENIFQEVELFVVKEAKAVGQEAYTIAKAFKEGVLKADQIAIYITQDINAALQSGTADDIAQILSGIFPSVKNIPAELVAELRIAIPEGLAIELGLQAELTNYSPDNTGAFVTAILGAFKVDADNSKMWSELSVKITTKLQNTPRTFAGIVKAIDEIFLEIKDELQPTE